MSTKQYSLYSEYGVWYSTPIAAGGDSSAMKSCATSEVTHFDCERMPQNKKRIANCKLNVKEIVKTLTHVLLLTVLRSTRIVVFSTALFFY